MTERRNFWFFLFAVVGQLLLLAAQLPSGSDVAGSSRLEKSLLRIASPFAHGVTRARGFVRDVAQGLATRSRVLEENRRLRAENQTLEELRVRSFGLEQEAEHLALAVQYAAGRPEAVQLADVVHLDRSSWLRTLVLRVHPGSAQPSQPVVTPDGLVGRVVVAAGRYAKVQLITDVAASAGAMVERTRRQGLVRGKDEGQLVLELIPSQEDVVVGDRIVTAGIDGVYPRGLPIGVVATVEPGDELFLEIGVRPLVDLGRLDHVYLLEVEQPPKDVTAETETPGGAE